MPYLREALEVSMVGTTTPQERGRRFERALRQALLVHPAEWGSSRFKDVWLWRDWPQREQFGFNPKELGIDIVASTCESVHESGGGYVAIQAKFGLSDISTHEIDSFLAASDNSKIFGERVLVADRRISSNGELKLEKAHPRCQILRLSEIDSWVDDWRDYIPHQIEELRIEFSKHEPRDYQANALEAIKRTFAQSDRGKLILPCGTGKSFVALRAAEENAGVGHTVLYLVPSISLMGQTMREWSRHRTIEHQYVGICSDVTTGQNPDRKSEGYLPGVFSELYMPVTTSLEKITNALAKPVPTDQMRVVFSTYQSSIKLVEALNSEPLRGYCFDLAICDEAHRTTGIESSANRRESNPKRFQLIHSNENIRAGKRLYMTATPRVFAENVRVRMEQKSFDGQSFSMDDEDIYGAEAYRMSFAEAIDSNWLSDYRVVVIGVSEKDYLDRAKDNPIKLDDGTQVHAETVVRLAGCWDALATPSSQTVEFDRNLGEMDPESHRHARSAIAFTNNIKDSKLASELWQTVASWHQESENSDSSNYLNLTVEHLDAKTPSSERHTLIESLRRSDVDGRCNVLSNVGVLSEGVDIPALDAIVFLQSRSSPVEVTQAVGRVMRRAEGKKFGYVVIPVIVPEFRVGSEEDNEPVENLLDTSDFKPVWDVVRALRSHDERIAHMLEARTMPIELRIPTKALSTKEEQVGNGQTANFRDLFHDTMERFNKRFSSVMLDVCGDRHMYPNWGDKAGVVCKQIKIRLDSLIENWAMIRSEFTTFHESLQHSVSPNISFDETVRMVAHHLVTVPVFEEVFSESNFADRNPIAQSMAKISATLAAEGADFEQERRPLKHAYRMMNTAFKSAEDPSRRLDVLRSIFEKFFQKAIPEQVKTMGIAYTPIELVDFMIKFVDRLCRKEFNRGLTAANVHILDPFSGTGTFLSHLLECKDSLGEYIIQDDDLERKYENEMHANELVLLAYYISALKIEETKHKRTMIAYGESDRDKVDYDPFDHIVFADTFHLGSNETGDALFGGLKFNRRRAEDQLSVPIQIILGNPPWSSGKDDASETATKTYYESIQRRISETYVSEHRKLGKKTGGNATGNLYVSAFRWATDRVMKNPANLPSIIAFVSPNSLTDGTSLAGMRKALRDEFSDIYVVNLRGNAYKQGEEWKREGDKIFGGASRNGVQITFLVRNPSRSEHGTANLYYASVPERMSLDLKYDWLRKLGDTDSVPFEKVPVTPNHDWTNLQNPEFDDLLRVCRPNRKEGGNDWLVYSHCAGITTGLDRYVIAFSRDDLCAKVKRLIVEFRSCLALYLESDQSEGALTKIITTRSSKSIKWTDKLRNALRRRLLLEFDENRIREVLYRPFTKCFVYEDYNIIASGKAASKLFPHVSPPPRIITTSASNKAMHGCIATHYLPDLCATGTQQGSRILTMQS